MYFDSGGVTPQCPTASQQRSHQQPTFVQQQQARATAAGVLFDARPILGQPPSNGLVVPIAGHAAGLLRCVPPLTQPSAQVVGVEADAELLRDESGQARGRPQVGGEAVLGRRVGQPTQHDLLLSGAKFGGTTEAGCGMGRQAVGTVAAEGGQPAPDATGSDAEKVGNLLGRVPLGKALNSEMPPTL